MGTSLGCCVETEQSDDYGRLSVGTYSAPSDTYTNNNISNVQYRESIRQTYGGYSNKQIGLSRPKAFKDSNNPQTLASRAKNTWKNMTTGSTSKNGKKLYGLSPITEKTQNLRKKKAPKPQKRQDYY